MGKLKVGDFVIFNLTLNQAQLLLLIIRCVFFTINHFFLPKLKLEER